jgi:hypothetical protein
MPDGARPKAALAVRDAFDPLWIEVCAGPSNTTGPTVGSGSAVPEVGTAARWCERVASGASAPCRRRRRAPCAAPEADAEPAAALRGRRVARHGGRDAEPSRSGAPARRAGSPMAQAAFGSRRACGGRAPLIPELRPRAETDGGSLVPIVRGLP